MSYLLLLVVTGIVPLASGASVMPGVSQTAPARRVVPHQAPPAPRSLHERTPKGPQACPPQSPAGAIRRIPEGRSAPPARALQASVTTRHEACQNDS
jgi:hypothetical protein